jgi:hypothetical protein
MITNLTINKDPKNLLKSSGRFFSLKPAVIGKKSFLSIVVIILKIIG